MNQTDQLAALLSPDVIPYAERINMPYLGYHVLRETLTSKLLGESESPILFWMGKELGGQIAIQSASGIILPFIRLGLGKLDVLEEGERLIRYRLFHSIYSYMSSERLRRALSLECGIIAGAVNRWRNWDSQTRLELEETGSVIIEVRAPA
jgi:hypothetical protein